MTEYNWSEIKRKLSYDSWYRSWAVCTKNLPEEIRDKFWETLWVVTDIVHRQVHQTIQEDLKFLE